MKLKMMRMKSKKNFNIIDLNNFEMKYNEIIQILRSSNRIDLRVQSIEKCLIDFINDYDEDAIITKKLIESIRYYCYSNNLNKKTCKVVNSISFRKIKNKINKE